MRRSVCVFPGFIFLLYMLFVAGTCSAQSRERDFSIAGIHDSKEVNTFLIDLQAALMEHNHRSVADMVSYPITAHTPSGSIRIRTPEQLLKRFDDVFDAYVSKVILCQKFETLGVTQYGVLVGRGIIYFGLVYQKDKSDKNYHEDIRSLDDRDLWKIKIIAINRTSSVSEESYLDLSCNLNK